jgi:hypothetical protein
MTLSNHNHLTKVPFLYITVRLSFYSRGNHETHGFVETMEIKLQHEFWRWQTIAHSKKGKRLSQRERSTIFFSLVLFVPSMSWMMYTHPHWSGGCNLLYFHPPIQMLISFRNTLKDITRNVFNQISGYPVTHWSWNIKLIIIARHGGTHLQSHLFRSPGQEDLESKASPSKVGETIS